MKNKRYYIRNWKRFIAVYLVFLISIIALNAQINPKTYYQCGWQFDFPINSSFSNSMNDLGLYVDAGYYFTPNISLGGFINVNTQYDEAVHSDGNANPEIPESIKEKSSYISVPFGASVRYRVTDETWWQPYISAKVGVNYTEAKSTMPFDTYSDKSWGFYISPELGINLFPIKHYLLGINVAAYYAFSTNRHDVSSKQVNGLNSVGVRLGVNFKKNISRYIR